jgi:hypothetical protein
MKKLRKKRIVGAVLLAGLIFLGAGLPASASQYALTDRQTVSNQELDTMRGGFVTDSGFQFSLGIIKAVVIDGVLQTVGSMNIPNMANLKGTSIIAPSTELTDKPVTAPTSGSSATIPTTTPTTVPTTASPTISAPTQAQNAAQQPSSVTVVQNAGEQMLVQQGNQILDPHAGGSTIVQNTGNGTLIQNSANQKVIQNMTVLNMTTNSLSMLRQMNISANIRQQFVNALH